MSSENYDHMFPELRLLMGKPDSARLAFLDRDYWVPYPLAEIHLQRLKYYATMPRTDRMLGGLIYGPSNNGKSSLITEFTHQCNGAGREGDGSSTLVYAKMLAPPQADEGRLYLEILKIFSASIGRSTSTKELQKAADFHLAGSGIQLLFIDEFQHLVAGSSMQHRVCMNAIKNLSSKHRLSIVGCGIPTAFNAIFSDPQIENRFFPMELPAWKYGDDFKVLLSRIEQRLPLKKPSNLSQGPLAKLIHGRTTGLIGEVVELCRTAAKFAITESKAECIRQQEIDGCGYLGPEQRRNRFLGQ